MGNLTAHGPVDDLLGRARARRRLPIPSERREIRERAGVSLREVARALGVSHTAVRMWEEGARPRGMEAQYAQLLDGLRELADGA